MELTKSEAKVVIAGRLPRKFAGKYLLAFLAVLFIGMIMAVSGDAVDRYTLSNGNTLEVSTAYIVYDNGAVIEPIETVRNNQAMSTIGAFITLLSLVWFVWFPLVTSKNQKLALIQYEKDGTLPPIPPEKPKKVTK